MPKIFRQLPLFLILLLLIVLPLVESGIFANEHNESAQPVDTPENKLADRVKEGAKDGVAQDQHTSDEESTTRGTVKLTNKTDTGDPVAGVMFTLYKKATDDDEKITTFETTDGDEIDVVKIVEKLTANEAGQLTVEDLSIGEYFFVETTSDSHYEVTEELISFDIIDDQVVSVTAIHEKTDKQTETNTKEKTDKSTVKKNSTTDPSTVEQANKENDETLKKEDKQQSTDQSTPTNSDERLPITPFVGNANIDIDISPYQDEVLAGNDALYKLTLKVTGAKTKYTDNQLIVDLPIEDYTHFTQDLSELVIAGVEPTYNSETGQLVYDIAELKAGQTYETLIYINTTNGETPNDTNLTAKASFEAAEQSLLEDEATITTVADMNITLTKQYKGAYTASGEESHPAPGNDTTWEINVNIPKKDVGQLFLKEGSTITITDAFSEAFSYVEVLDETPVPDESDRTLTWELDAPTILEQAEATDDIYTVTLLVSLKIEDDDSLIQTIQSNDATVQVETIDNLTASEATTTSIYIVDAEGSHGSTTGNYIRAAHFGPLDGEGGFSKADNRNPNPIVGQDALLSFRHGVTPFPPVYDKPPREFTTIYEIDDNLILNSVTPPGRFIYARTNTESQLDIPLPEEPVFNIEAIVDGELRTLVTDATSNFRYTRASLGLKKDEHVSEVRINFTNMPAGVYAKNIVRLFFDVKPGTVGEVENKFDVRILPHEDAYDGTFETDEDGYFYYKKHLNSGWNQLASNRQATIQEETQLEPPIVTVGIELNDHESGIVVPGDNRMSIKMMTDSNSPQSMDGPVEAVALLPNGITLKDDPKPSYVDANGFTGSGTYEILDDNYEGTGRQLVKVTWEDLNVKKGRQLEAQLDVNISEDAPSKLTFDVYGFSAEDELDVPATSGHSITNTILQTDIGDLNGNGIEDEPRLKSGNVYTIPGKYDVQTEKLIKGELDDTWSTFAETKPGGNIDYQLKLTNTTGKDITNLVLLDVLPSIGDLGITDHINRESQFTPTLTGPLTIPATWKDKVDVLYSTAKNPERDDLTKNTIWPDTTEQLTNPASAETPNWQLEGDISDWSTIHSFKIELKDDAEWIEGEDITIEYRMKAPEKDAVDQSVLDRSIDPKSRAAWNSFALQTEHGQPVEPERVGVYMNEPRGAVELTKTNEAGEPLAGAVFDLYKGDEKIEENLTTNADGKIRALNLAFSNDYYFVETKAPTGYKLDETPVEFTIDESGSFDSEGKHVGTVVTKTMTNEPLDGSVIINKVDAATGEKLSGASFELRDEADEVVASGTTDDAGEILLTDIPIGTYTVHETKAPEGYRLLTSPIDVEVTIDHLHVEVTAENSEIAWQLPHVGGIGTMIFYGIGALLMIGAITFLFRRNT